MNNNTYTLQFLNHAEVFSTRDEAVAYINEEFKNKALVAEPAVVFYGDTTKPNLILAICSGERKVFLIDTANLEGKIDAISDTADADHTDVETVKAELKNLIEVCGLFYNDNVKENPISYEPNKKDELIGDSTTLADAIAKISEYVQTQFAAADLSVKNSKSIELTYEDSASGGKELSANVLLSTDGDTDDDAFNDNILVTKDDGLFVSANLKYDKDKNTLTFTTSGLKNGRPSDEAYKQVVELGEHTEYEGYSKGHTVDVSVDNTARQISADVKLSDDEDNIITLKDGKLFVDGRAINIKYKGKTVYAGINALEESVAAVKESIEKLEADNVIEGSTTDTTVTTATKLVNGGYRIETGVRLGSNQSIKLINGGLEADIEIDSDTVNNKLIVRVGNTSKEVILPGVSIFDKATYNSSTKTIVISFKDGSSISIPVGDMLKTFVVANDAASPVVLSKTESTVTGEADQLSASLKIANSDNLLDKTTDGYLYVKESKIDEKVAVETSRATNAEKELKSVIDSNKTDADTKHETLKSAIDTNTANITAEQSRAEQAESDIKNIANTNKDNITVINNTLKEHTSSIETINSDIVSIKGNVENAQSNIAANATKISTLETKVGNVEDKANANETEISHINDTLSSMQSDIATNSDNIKALQLQTQSQGENISNVKEALADEISLRKESDSNLDVKITANATNIQSEIDRAKEVEKSIETSIVTANSAITSEVDRAKEAEKTLQSNIDATNQSVAILNGDATTSGSVREIVKHASDDLTLLVSNESVSRASADENLQTQIDALKSSSSEGSDKALKEAKEYTDAEIEKLSTATNTNIADAKREAILTAAEDATTKADKALSDSKSYTDTETERAQAAEKANADAITALQDKDAELESSIAAKIGQVEIVKNSQSDLQYVLKVDGKDAGEINIPKDQFLKSATYNEASKELEFVFVTSDGETTSKIDMSDLIDTYLAGNGLSLSENKFSVKIDPSSEYLSVSEDGVKVSGIDAKLSEKANVLDVYTKTEADTKFLTEHQSLNDYALKTDVDAVSEDLTELKAKVVADEVIITKLDGNEAVDGSVANALKIAKEYADNQLVIETERAKAAEKANADAIAILNGNEAQEGSVKNAISTANKYTDNAVLTEANTRTEAVNAINSTLSTKANADDVYTKAEIDAKGYLTEHQDISGKADKTDLTSLEARVEINENAINVLNGDGTGSVKKSIDDAITVKANAADVYTKHEIDDKNFLTATDIEGLASETELTDVKADIAAIQVVDSEQNTRISDAEKELTRLNITTIETNSIKPSVSKSDTGTTLSADVKLDTEKNNIIKISGNGVYAEVSMTYDKATNTIVFNNGVAEQSFVLSDQSLLTAGSYDSTNKEIVLTITKSDSTTQEIRIPIGDIINDWDVTNSADNLITLTKTAGVDGIDLLSAKLSISTHEDNGVLKDNGTLFVSKAAKDHTTTWNNGTTTVQTALDELKTEADKVETLVSDVSTLKTDVATMKVSITAIEGDVAEVQEKVSNNSEKISENTGAINSLSTQMTTLSGEVNDLSNNFEALKTTVEAYEDRISALETSVETLKAEIGDPSSDKTIAERLAIIEQTLDTLIDFGTYSIS